MLILFGNAAVLQPTEGLDNASNAVTGKWEDGHEIPQHDSVTAFQIPEVDSLADTLLTVTKTWAQNHSTLPPTWVASDNPAAAALFASNYNCPTEDIDTAMTAYQGAN